MAIAWVLNFFCLFFTPFNKFKDHFELDTSRYLRDLGEIFLLTFLIKEHPLKHKFSPCFRLDLTILTTLGTLGTHIISSRFAVYISRTSTLLTRKTLSIRVVKAFFTQTPGDKRDRAKSPVTYVSLFF